MILVVDDQEDIRDVLIQLLRLDGYEAVGASDGSEALRLLHKDVPSLVFLDFMLPDMDGLEIFREMKKDPELARVPVIMFSAVEGTQKDAVMKAGFDAYVSKSSFDWMTLRNEVHRLSKAATN